MAAPETTRIAHFLLENIPETVTAYVNDKSAVMIGYIGPTAVILLTLFVLFWGVAMASGQISEPFTDGMKRIIRMCIIVGFALTVGIYQDYVADFFLRVPSEMASELAYEGSSGGYEPVSIATVLDASLQQGFDVGDKAWDKGDEMAQTGIKAAIAGMGYYALAILVYLAAAASSRSRGHPAGGLPRHGVAAGARPLVHPFCHLSHDLPLVRDLAGAARQLRDPLCHGRSDRRPGLRNVRPVLVHAADHHAIGDRSQHAEADRDDHRDRCRPAADQINGRGTRWRSRNGFAEPRGQTCVDGWRLHAGRDHWQFQSRFDAERVRGQRDRVDGCSRGASGKLCCEERT